MGEEIGSYNKKFAEKWGKYFVKAFGATAENVDKMSQKQVLQVMQQLNTKVYETIG